MKILGIHDGHNASVTLLDNGEIKLAIQEERFTYNKNQGGLPISAINSVRENFGFSDSDLVGVASFHIPTYDWSKQKILKLYAESDSPKSILRSYAKNSDLIYKAYSKNVTRFRRKIISQTFPKNKIEYVDHHFCHAATAYFGLGIYDQDILLITADGEGDGKCAGVYLGNGGEIKELEFLETKHSLGRLYSYITFLFNMLPFEHEYKVMGLAPYCKDRDRIEKCKKDFYSILSYTNKEDTFWQYKGKYPSIQSAGKEIKAIFNKYRFDVISAALQEFTEELVCELVSRCIRKYGINTIGLSGGIFMNVKANMLIAELPQVKKVFVFPSCGDESNTIGLVNYLNYKYNKILPKPLDGFYLGDEFRLVESELSKLNKDNLEITEPQDIEHSIAKLLADGEIVGRIKGKMEFGARALGNRSILANPSVNDVLRTINDMIKNRDFWMPFAPSVLYEDISNYFHINSSVVDYEYMIFTCNSKIEKRKYAKNALHPYDYTGRPQAVKKQQNPDYYKLISKYKELTGESLILNTSYNLHGFPIVRTQEQALHVFFESGLKYLALDKFLLRKKLS